MGKIIIATLLFFITLDTGYSQDARVAAVAFYNLENLFDTEDDPNISDEEFTPQGSKRWTDEKYEEKLSNLARVISDMATEITPDGPAVIGVAEIENLKVLQDLVKQPAIAKRNYKIVHYDSKDFRGVDVAFLYQEKYFVPKNSKPVSVDMFDDSGKKMFSRDILLISGDFDGQEMHFMVNHWPSRRGGQKASAPRRNASAAKNRELADSILAVTPKAGIIVMGDFNDDPNNESITKFLGADGNLKKAINNKSFFNPYYDLFKKGIGSNAYRDSWSLFDQVILSHTLLNQESEGYYYYKSIVFNKPYLVQKTGQYKGYPYRTFDFDNYIGGYSDHLPVYIVLVKKL